MTDYFHGIKITESSDTVPQTTIMSPSTIAVVGTATSVPSGCKDNEPFVVTSQTKAKEFKGGTISQALRAIFIQTRARVIVIKKTEDKIASGIDALKFAELKTGYRPSIILAPQLFGEKSTPDQEKKFTSIATKLTEISGKIKAVAILDTPEEKTKIGQLDSLLSTRLIAAYPAAISVDPNDESKTETSPLSPWLAGRIVKTDQEYGFWHSPSNRVIEGIVGLSKNIDYEGDDLQSQANVLNGNKITTVIRDGGFRYWGNTGLYPSAEANYKFISVLRTKDVLNQSLKESLRWAVDRGITRNLIEQITGAVTNFLSNLRKKGAILNGSCWPNSELNTPDEIAKGNLHFVYDFTPVYIAERIEFTSVLTNKYIADIVKEP